jgi:hypothetical protein
MRLSIDSAGMGVAETERRTVTLVSYDTQRGAIPNDLPLAMMARRPKRVIARKNMANMVGFGGGGRGGVGGLLVRKSDSLLWRNGCHGRSDISTRTHCRSVIAKVDVQRRRRIGKAKGNVPIGT